MDNAVAIVQAYLRLNGYFTVTEFPVVQAMRDGSHRAATDIDVLAFRFPGSGRLVPRVGTSSKRDRLLGPPDPALGIAEDEADMIIGEVKEGRAELNRGALDPAVLRAVLTRFGCCGHDVADDLVQSLIRKGRARTLDGHTIRIVAFGTSIDGPRSGFHAITLAHVINFTCTFLRENWDVFRVAEFKDPALGLLAAVIKSGADVGAQSGDDADGS